MAKFNVVQKQRRDHISQMKRAAHGDPLTKKLKIKQQPTYVSAKRQRKLMKKKRREDKEKVGLTNMEDVEMCVDEGLVNATRKSTKFRMKMHVRTRKLKNKAKNKLKSSKLRSEASGEDMIE